MAISFCDDVMRLCRRAPSCCNVIKLRNACFYPHYRHKLILFVLSPLRCPCAKRRGESANTNGFCALYDVNFHDFHDL